MAGGWGGRVVRVKIFRWDGMPPTAGWIAISERDVEQKAAEPPILERLPCFPLTWDCATALGDYSWQVKAKDRLSVS